MPTSELVKESLTRTRVAEAEVKERCDAIAVVSLGMLPENYQTKKSKKKMMQVKIRDKKEKYTSTSKKRTATRT